MYFLFYFLVFTQTVVSGLLPNLGTRSIALTHYTVYLVDPNAREKSSEIDFFLKSLYGEDVVDVRNEDGTISWEIALKDAGRIEALKEHGELRIVKQSSDISKRDDIRYCAFARNVDNNDEVTNTRKFLDTKVTVGTIINEVWLGDHIIAWGNLALDSTAKTDVENYPGIDGITEDLDAVPDKAVDEDRSDTMDDMHQLFKKESKWSSRSLTWDKQENGPKDLVMDSQYP